MTQSGHLHACDPVTLRDKCEILAATHLSRASVYRALAR
jgi:hypothetical protein